MNTSQNFNTPYFNKDSKLSNTINSKKNQDLVNQLNSSTGQSAMNSTQNNFMRVNGSNFERSNSFEDREDISQSNQTNAFY